MAPTQKMGWKIWSRLRKTWSSLRPILMTNQHEFGKNLPAGSKDIKQKTKIAMPTLLCWPLNDGVKVTKRLSTLRRVQMIHPCKFNKNLPTGLTDTVLTRNLHATAYTLQPLYKTVRYNTVLDITWFKDGSQKCIDYIEKWP